MRPWRHEPRRSWPCSAGLLAPLLFTITWLAAGWLRPGYNPLVDDISALAATGTPLAGLMVAGFVLSGLLIVAFAVGLAAAVRRRGGSWLGPALVGLIGLGIVALGIFPEDAPGGPVAGSRGTVSNQLHDAVSVLLLLALVVAPPLVARAFRHDPAGRWLARSAWLVSLLTLGLVVVYLPRLSAWSGLIQRALIGGPLLWLTLLAAYLSRDRDG